jgi:hypothetical protein
VVKREMNKRTNAKISKIEAPGQCMVLNKIPTVASPSISPFKIGFDFMIELFWGFGVGNCGHKENIVAVATCDNKHSCHFSALTFVES